MAQITWQLSTSSSVTVPVNGNTTIRLTGSAVSSLYTISSAYLTIGITGCITPWTQGNVTFVGTDSSGFQTFSTGTDSSPYNDSPNFLTTVVQVNTTYVDVVIYNTSSQYPAIITSASLLITYGTTSSSSTSVSIGNWSGTESGILTYPSTTYSSSSLPVVRPTGANKLFSIVSATVNGSTLSSSDISTNFSLTSTGGINFLNTNLIGYTSVIVVRLTATLLNYSTSYATKTFRITYSKGVGYYKTSVLSTNTNTITLDGLGSGTVTYPSSITIATSSDGSGEVSSSYYTYDSSTHTITFNPVGISSGTYYVFGDVSVASSTEYNSANISATWACTLDKSVPQLSFTVDSETVRTCYSNAWKNSNGSRLGKVTYTGDGTAYYYVSTSSSTPTFSTSTWTSVANGEYVRTGVQAVPGTYYVWLYSTSTTNYTGDTVISVGSTTIIRKTPTLSIYPGGTSTRTYGVDVGSDEGVVTYNGDGTAYYYVSTSSSTPTFSTSTWTSVTSGSRISFVNKNVGTYYVYLHSTLGTYFKALTTSLGYTVTINKATPTWTYTDPTAQTYKTSGTYSVTIGASVTGGGTVTYPSSITVKKGSTTLSTSYYSYNQSTHTITVTASTSVPAGTYTVTGSVSAAASTNYTALESTSHDWTVTINKAAATCTQSATSYSTNFSTSSQTITLSCTGSGTVTYDSSPTVAISGAGITSGWTINNTSGVLTIVDGMAAGTYSVSTTVRVAASTNYNSGSFTKTWTITINKIANPFTLDEESVTLYYLSGVGSDYTYNTYTIPYSNAVGAVTFTTTDTSVVSVDPSTGVVSYLGAGTAHITCTAAGGTNYNSKSLTFAVTCEVDTQTYSDWGSYTSYGTPTASYNNNTLTAGGGSVVITPSVTNTCNKNYYFKSGYSKTVSESRTGSCTISIYNQVYGDSDGNTDYTITRFSLSGTTLSHTTMGTNIGTDGCIIHIVNNLSTDKCLSKKFTVDNSLESITLLVGSTEIVFGESTTAVVVAQYTSGSEPTVTTSATITSNPTGYVTITNN